MDGFRSAALVISGLLLASALSAGSVSAPMQVSVQVVARAIVTVQNAPAITITAEDIARGYAEVASPVLLVARTNSRRGYVLQAEMTGEEFTAVELTMPGATMSVSSHESWLQRPYVAGGEVLPVTMRLILSPRATAGTHALPVSFSASPL
jgi:hypothetical protein